MDCHCKGDIVFVDLFLISNPFSFLISECINIFDKNSKKL